MSHEKGFVMFENMIITDEQIEECQDRDIFEEDEEIHDESAVIGTIDNLVEKSEALAKRYILEFFADKEMHYGGRISESTLHAPGYLWWVLNLDISQGVVVAYDAIDRSGEYGTDCDGEDISDDVKLVIGIIHECSRKNIPKQFVAGIVLMYLELCLGISLE